MVKHSMQRSQGENCDKEEKRGQCDLKEVSLEASSKKSGCKAGKDHVDLNKLI